MEQREKIRHEDSIKETLPDPKSLWIDPEGNVHELPRDTHEVWAWTQHKKHIQEMERDGWLRCVNYRSHFILEFDRLSAIQRISENTMRSLEDYLENIARNTKNKDYKLIVWIITPHKVMIDMPVKKLFDGNFRENLYSEVRRGLAAAEIRLGRYH